MLPVTLLSDFGLQDASVAIAKGILLQHVPGVQLVDISHLVEPFNMQQAAYLLRSAFPYFPSGTCHVLLFDLMAEREPRLMLCAHEGQYLIAPDNGLLSLAFGEAVGSEVWRCQEIAAAGAFADWLQGIGRTLAQLQTHAAADLGLVPCTLSVAPHQWLPRIDGDSVECHVIHIDRYENVITNLTRTLFDEIGRGRPFRIEWLRGEEAITQLTTHFHEVSESRMLCRFNSTGFLEICINRGKAASLFGFRLFREKHFIYNSIRVFFG